jgi:rare lipoprotein A
LTSRCDARVGFPYLWTAMFAGFCAILSGCTTSSTSTHKGDASGAGSTEGVVAEGEALPRGGGRAHVGRPYKIGNKWYKPKEDPDYDQVGMASWYGSGFHGQRTANGEVFDRMALSAAHPTLPLPSYVRVTNLNNRRSIVLRVNDRGPFSHRRLIDVSERAADMLGFKRAGYSKVRVEYIEPARLDGRDDDFLLASYREAYPIDDAPVQVAEAAPRRPAPKPKPAAESPVVLAAKAAPAAEAKPAAASVAFTDAPQSSEAPAAVAAAEGISTEYGADERISMAFQLLDGADY